ncbi:hypothetical protein EXIGLDRAFT_501842 [Exidia glandulosa HHB12029]|uniref:Uncharacterized protein n=1 Tax=Exidia glandulosa HHB12029 TaxID=1314781 RepID=A0A165JED1_EXIGL|nr:hypothetical protein EXIGLDRAFT_501842 [Exidia glandulosa HHB12029]
MNSSRLGRRSDFTLSLGNLPALTPADRAWRKNLQLSLRQAHALLTEVPLPSANRTSATLDARPEARHVSEQPALVSRSERDTIALSEVRDASIRTTDGVVTWGDLRLRGERTTTSTLRIVLGFCSRQGTGRVDCERGETYTSTKSTTIAGEDGPCARGQRSVHVNGKLKWEVCRTESQVCCEVGKVSVAGGSKVAGPGQKRVYRGEEVVCN